MRRPHPWRRLGSLLRRGGRRRPAPEPIELVDASLHTESEAICPDCLTWIQPGDYLRRNAYGLLEHEVCPPEAVHGDTLR